MAKIADKLDNINRTLEKMLEVMEKPEHTLIKALVIGGLLAGIFGMISEFDIIIKWFKEGLW
ncbi:MAG: hypothetical protein FWD40_05475 [Treponema sp.]|nr:hypothetical protein [Treponema sp.]